MSKIDTIGINEPQIKVIIDKLTSNIERLDKKFNQIDNIIYNMYNSYNSESTLTYKKKYENIRLNYDIIKKNLLSYVEDLEKLIINYKKLEATAADMVNSFKVSGGI